MMTRPSLRWFLHRDDLRVGMILRLHPPCADDALAQCEGRPVWAGLAEVAGGCGHVLCALIGGRGD